MLDALLSEIEWLLSVVRPQKLLYLAIGKFSRTESQRCAVTQFPNNRHHRLLLLIEKAFLIMCQPVDGVAPRAKMNQQRSRRFLKAQEEHTWDTNCITPGMQ